MNELTKHKNDVKSNTSHDSILPILLNGNNDNNDMECNKWHHTSELDNCDYSTKNTSSGNELMAQQQHEQNSNGCSGDTIDDDEDEEQNRKRENLLNMYPQ